MEFVELTEQEYHDFVSGHEQESYMQTLELKRFNNPLVLYIKKASNSNELNTITIFFFLLVVKQTTK